MPHLLACLLLLSLLACPGAAPAAEPVTLANQPPVVVATWPRAGDPAVPPGPAQIKVTFSKEMMTNNMWSWVMVSKQSFPTLTGPVRFLDDKRTCAAQVTLAPGRTYAIWFNSAKHQNFRDAGNLPAVPYLLVFSTSK